MPWKSVYKNKKECKTERTLVLLLGGSIYDDDLDIQIANRRRRGDDRFRTKQDVHLDEHLWQRDCRAITEFFERTHATIWRSVPARLRSSRNESFDLINEFFQMNRIDIKGERTTFILYWGGHGIKDTGNWGFSSGGEITCRDVINAWYARPFADDFNDTSSLTIIADTCYSGAWIETLRTENIPRLAYQAASRADEVAYVINDGNIPRSLLMRKFIIEQQYPIGWYLWTCIDQHPTHLCDYGEIEDGEDFCAGQQRTLVHGGPYYFFTVQRHWTTNGKISTKERKAELNKLAEYGVFIDNN
ncbi:unnamed protein product [Rotaria socialis]|uniref:Uncharacterized protein n=1 Tax=Rotaria socialis TaxID=392032 RepID=A0A818DV85_9BILA|nr:unnamed protein product [Rotaria socialis]CAF3530774.1 unnamed protein product [Rotaria socialis]CAF3538838.1 unnamed protein product [Rotaria socialis]CAF3621982.1 unnamed protein product [Rotaria socialis]CAF4271338.1 unnamed protein product [Rotaria socialis]